MWPLDKRVGLTQFEVQRSSVDTRYVKITINLGWFTKFLFALREINVLDTVMLKFCMLYVHSHDK